MRVLRIIHVMLINSLCTSVLLVCPSMVVIRGHALSLLSFCLVSRAEYFHQIFVFDEPTYLITNITGLIMSRSSHPIIY